MTFEDVLDAARRARPESPLPIVVSACLLGRPVGFDGSSWPSSLVQAVVDHPHVSAGVLCPEDTALGTPRAYMKLHHGDGHDVLEGRARVITIAGDDITEPFVAGARAMLTLAQETDAVLGLLQAVSPSCGSRVVHKGESEERAYRNGPGVTTALLRRHGVFVLSPRDERSLHRLLSALDPSHEPDADVIDFDEHPWFVEYFEGRGV